ncbi:MAG: FecR domain-containing protein [Opitutaceae bacterium]|nr:FecR domain-containing protein [Opitutaceae bacterium]
MSTHRSRPQTARDSAAIEQAAAAWVIRRDRGLSAEEVHEFTAWAEADPRHQDAYAEIAATWRGLDTAGLVPDLAAQADAVMHRATRRRHRRSWLPVTVSLGMAAALVLLITLRPGATDQSGQKTDPAKSPVSYQVLASTASQQVLPDGSVTQLNGSSRIATAYSANERRVHLLDGEAHFSVKKDTGRPFIVQVGHVAVRAVGTAFNVKMAPAGVEILVTEGLVRVDDAMRGDSLLDPSTTALQAGQKLIVSAPAGPESTPAVQYQDVAPGDIDLALSWQSTRLVFNDTPLNEVVAAFNRYNAMQLRIGDRELGQRTITGVFKAENLDGFLRLMQAGQVVQTFPGPAASTVLMPAR